MTWLVRLEHSVIWLRRYSCYLFFQSCLTKNQRILLSLIDLKSWVKKKKNLYIEAKASVLLCCSVHSLASYFFKFGKLMHYYRCFVPRGDLWSDSCCHFLINGLMQVLNGNPYNRKCDVYSFGICLWEIYCCDMPYPHLSFSEMTSAVVRQVRFPKLHILSTVTVTLDFVLGMLNLMEKVWSYWQKNSMPTSL